MNDDINDKIAELEREIAMLPEGSITKKRINILIKKYLSFSSRWVSLIWLCSTPKNYVARYMKSSIARKRFPSSIGIWKMKKNAL